MLKILGLVVLGFFLLFLFSAVVLGGQADEQMERYREKKELSDKVSGSGEEDTE